MAKKDRDLVYLRTTLRAKHDVYAEAVAKNEKRLLVLKKGEWDEANAIYSGSYYRKELEDWIEHARDNSGGGQYTKWDLVERDELPDDFEPNYVSLKL